jgi:hypothetical protein
MIRDAEHARDQRIGRGVVLATKPINLGHAEIVGLPTSGVIWHRSEATQPLPE